MALFSVLSPLLEGKSSQAYLRSKFCINGDLLADIFKMRQIIFAFTFVVMDLILEEDKPI
jgi:hypothetical protein